MTEIQYETRGLGDTSTEQLNKALVDVLKTMPTRLFDAPGDGLTDAEKDALVAGGLTFDDQNGTDPLAEGVAQYAAIVERSYRTKDVAKQLKVSAGRVRQMVADGSLYSFVLNGKRYIPDFQFSKGALLPNIARVNEVLPGFGHPVSIYRWYHLPSTELVQDGKALSPRDWLRAGNPVDEVVAAARQL